MIGGQVPIIPPKMRGGSGWRQGGQLSIGASAFKGGSSLSTFRLSPGYVSSNNMAGGRTRRLKRRLGKVRHRSGKTYSAGGRKTRRTRKHKKY
jgi:hypothetical protein